MAVTSLPRAMLIDMDDTILSAYGRPEIAWNHIAAEFADELAPLPPPAVAAAVLGFARNFWSTAEPAWRLKLGEARRLTVQGGFDALITGNFYSKKARHGNLRVGCLMYDVGWRCGASRRSIESYIRHHTSYIGL